MITKFSGSQQVIKISNKIFDIHLLTDENKNELLILTFIYLFIHKRRNFNSYSELGKVPKNLVKKLGELEIRGRIETIQTTAVLKSNGIRRWALEI